MNPLVVDIISTWVHALLNWLTAALITYHVITTPQGSALSSQLFTYTISSLPALLALGLSQWNRYGMRQKIVTALTMPVGTTIAQVEQKIASGVPLPPANLPKTAIPLAVAKVLIVGLLCFGFSACAGNLSQQVERSTRDAIKQSEVMHNAPAPKPTLTDVQFRAVNTELHTISVAGLAWTTAVANGDNPVTATAIFLAVFDQAVGRLVALAPAVVTTNIANDIATIRAKALATIGQ